MNEFKKWKKDYIEHLQPRAEMLVNAGELTQRRMEAAWLAGQAEGRKEAIMGVTVSQANEMMTVAVSAEREACVVISEHEKHIEPGNATVTQLNIATAIRQRG